MPFERRRHHPLHQHPLRIVLAPLEFIPHHGHFRLEVRFGHMAVDHPVGFEPQGKFEVFGRGGQCLVVVRPIEPGGSIELGTPFFHRRRDIGMRWRPFEEHVFEEVGHPRLPVALMAGADEVGDVDGHRRLGIVGQQ